jgi:hypothetical protein
MAFSSSGTGVGKLDYRIVTSMLNRYRVTGAIPHMLFQEPAQNDASPHSIPLRGL